MSTLTTNLGLVKPSGNERPQVSVINANMDVLDAVIGDPSNLRSGSDITSDIKALRDSVSLTKIDVDIELTNAGTSYTYTSDRLKSANEIYFITNNGIAVGPILRLSGVSEGGSSVNYKPQPTGTNYDISLDAWITWSTGEMRFRNGFRGTNTTTPVVKQILYR